METADGDMKDMGLRPGMAIDREKWRCGIMGRMSDPHKRGNNGRKTSSSSSNPPNNYKNPTPWLSDKSELKQPLRKIVYNR